MKKQIIATLAGLLLATASGTADEVTTIKLATIAPANTPWTDYMEEWKANVAEASGGEIDIQIFPSSQLGNEFDVYNQLKRGRIDSGLFSNEVFAEDNPEIALMSTPFLFDKLSTIDCMFDQELGDYFISLIEAEGMKFLQWQEVGWVHIYARDDLSNVADVDGYKARVAPAPQSRFLWSTIGANGIEITFAETTTALQTGQIRAAEIGGISFVALGLGDIAPHFIKTAHFHLAGAITMSNKKWESLTAEQQDIIIEELPPVQGVRDTLRQMNDYLLGEYASAGGPVHELSAEQRADWKAVFEPNWPEFVDSLGDGARDLWPRLLEAKQTCGE